MDLKTHQFYLMKCPHSKLKSVACPGIRAKNNISTSLHTTHTETHHIQNPLETQRNTETNALSLIQSSEKFGVLLRKKKIIQIKQFKIHFVSKKFKNHKVNYKLLTVQIVLFVYSTACLIILHTHIYLYTPAEPNSR